MLSKFFAFLFVVSISLFLFLWLTTSEPNKKHRDTIHYQKPNASLTIEPSNLLDIFEDSEFIMITSLSTSLFSFLGFLLSLRSSRKEQALLEIQMERENLEVEKLKAEIDNLKS